MATIIRPNTCSTCANRMRNGADLFCALYPPSTFPVPQQNGSVAWISNFPPVRPDSYCGQWAALSTVVRTIEGETAAAN